MIMFLVHILESINLISEYLNGIDKETFLETIQLQDSVIRRFEIIGEAAKNISKSTRTKYAEVPWKLMVGMRDILIHEYFGVDLDEVWGTCQNDLSNLKRQVEDIVENLASF